jgi:hypothetical protein
LSIGFGFGCCDVTSFNGSNASFAARSEIE